MSHFSFTRPGGVWSSFSDLLSGEMADIDAKTFKAINGDDGGTWAPSSVITVGGQGLDVTGSFRSDGAFDVFGNDPIFHNNLFVEGLFQATGTFTLFGGGTIGTTSSDALTVNAKSTFASISTFNGNAILNGHVTLAHNVSIGSSPADLLSVAAESQFSTDATFSSTLTVVGGLFADSGINVSGNGSIAGTLTVGNTLVMSGGANLASPLQCTSSGRILRSAVFGAVSGGGTFNPAVANSYFFSSGMASQSYALPTTGVLDGDFIEIALQTGTSGTLTVTGALGGTVSMRHSSSGDVWGIKFIYMAGLGAWAPFMVSAFP